MSTRRPVLKYAVVGLLVVFCVRSGPLAQRPANSTGNPSVREPEFKTCDFETVQTDAAGQVVSRVRMAVRCFDEPLGHGIVLRLVEVPAGNFIMGSPVSEPGRRSDEGPLHQVHIERFFLGQFEVTEEQYEMLRSRPAKKRKLDESLSIVLGLKEPSTAANGISWNDAEEFCARLSSQTGRPYRLPTEAEWEYAARAGGDFAYEFGPIYNYALMNNIGIVPRKQGEKGTEPLPVGTSGPANAFGLFDMLGNTSEWVQDRYHANYSHAPVDGSAWLKVESKAYRHEHVMRGGSYGMNIELLRVAAREHWDSGLSPSGFGFRVALSVSTK